MASGWGNGGGRGTLLLSVVRATRLLGGERVTPLLRGSGGRRAEWLLGGTGGGRGTLLLGVATGEGIGSSGGIGGGRGGTSSFSYQLSSGGGMFMGLVLPMSVFCGTIDEDECGRPVDVDVGAVV